MIVHQNEHLHNFIYIGETKYLSTRFRNHHKQIEITKNNANCIGIHTFFGTDEERINAETDILNNYDFPYNEQNNK